MYKMVPANPIPTWGQLAAGYCTSSRKPLILLVAQTDCDSGCRGFESHQPPHLFRCTSTTYCCCAVLTSGCCVKTVSIICANGRKVSTCTCEYRSRVAVLDQPPKASIAQSGAPPLRSHVAKVWR